jgi:hypothetical protein
LCVRDVFKQKNNPKNYIKMEQNCNEQFLDDIVKVQLVLAAECDMAIPFQVSGITVMQGTKDVSGQAVDRIGTPVVSVAFDPTLSEQAEILSAPTLKQTEKRVPAGITVQHQLEVPILVGFQDLRAAVAQCQTKDMITVLTSAEGVRYVLYAVPGSSSVLLDEQGINQQGTLKVQLTSMSHVIKLI